MPERRLEFTFDAGEHEAGSVPIERNPATPGGKMEQVSVSPVSTDSAHQNPDAVRTVAIVREVLNKGGESSTARESAETKLRQDIQGSMEALFAEPPATISEFEAQKRYINSLVSRLGVTIGKEPAHEFAASIRSGLTKKAGQEPSVHYRSFLHKWIDRVSTRLLDKHLIETPLEWE